MFFKNNNHFYTNLADLYTDFERNPTNNKKCLFFVTAVFHSKYTETSFI